MTPPKQSWDLSPEMIGQARQNYPHMTFALQDVTKLSFEGEFDAVFSNATLHWVLDAEAAVRAMARALKPGGRFVAEFGGAKNIERIESALREAVAKYAEALPPSPWYFPTIGEYASLLEGVKLEVLLVQLFDRPTALDGAHGMENWIQQFGAYYLGAVARTERSALVRRRIVTAACDAGWFVVC